MDKYDFDKIRVLVVDDSAYMIRIVLMLLNAMGIRQIRSVTCPADVFTVIEEWQPDLIIADHLMQPLTGLELIKLIRDDEDCPIRFVPIILLTGHAKEDVVKSARFSSGADAVLVKPVSAQRLYETIVAIYKSDRTFVEAKGYFGPDRRVKDRPFEGEDKRSLGIDGGADPSNDDELVFADSESSGAGADKAGVA